MVRGCNNRSNGRNRPGGSMFVTQKLGDGDAKKVNMKLPRICDIQRLMLARNLMYLRHPEVRHGRTECPKEFQSKVARFRKLGIDMRASGSRGGIRKSIRRKRDVVEKNQVHVITSTSEKDTQQENQKWNIQEMFFVPDMLQERRSKLYIKDRPKKRTVKQIEEEERKSNEEEWQRQNWLKNVIRDMKSDRVNEILANCRMTCIDGAAVEYQPTYTIFLESAHYALKTHNWAAIAQCLCGMADKFRTTQYMRQNWQFPSGLNIFWMLGFLTIANHPKDNISQVEQFAKNVHTVLGGHPLWIASHLAVWFIQKGYFMSAYRIVNQEYSLDNLPTFSRFQSPWYTKKENPKRDLAIYLTSLIKAVYLFCIWKKESTILKVQENNESHDDAAEDLGDVIALRRDALRRKGEDALGAFEICYDKYKAIEGDAMCFVQPFIELVVEFRSVQRARDILEEVFNINDGNLFVEEFYAEFLEEHFCYSEDDQDLIKFLKRRTKRKFDLEGKDRKETIKKGARRIKEMKRTRVENGKYGNSNDNSVFKMKKILKPAFSW